MRNRALFTNGLLDDTLGLTKNSEGFPQMDVQIKIEPATLLLLIGGVAGAIVVNKIINRIL